jgi:hypothetical protein
MLQLQHIIPKFKDKIAFVPVSLDGSLDAARKFMDANSLKFDAYANPQQAALVRLNIRYIPTLVLVNAAGETVKTQVGALPDNEMEQLLNSLIR